MTQMLKQACDAILADNNLKQNAQGQTFCNIAVQRALSLMGALPPGGTANAMIDKMASSWAQVTGEQAHALALDGQIVVAAQKGAAHGHVALVYPAPMELSGSWNKHVPMLANVGKSSVSGLVRASRAFRTEPAYYAYPDEKLDG